MKHLLFIIIAILALLCLFSCSVTQEMTVKPDFSGTASGSVILHPVFADYLSSFAEISGMGSRFAFNTEEIKAGLEKSPGTKVTRIISPKPEELSYSLTFQDIETLLSQDPGISQSGLIRASRQDGVNRLSLYLDRKNYPQLVALIPALDNPLFSALGPLENEGTSESDYLEMMEYALGEEGPDLIKRSSVSLTIKVQGTVVSHRGGEPVPGGVRFNIPLIRILLLDKPIDLSLDYR